MRDYPAEMPIRVLNRPLDHTIRLPGSKSITNRALVISALAGGDCRLKGALLSEDTKVMIESLRRLGFAIEISEEHIDVARNVTGRLVPLRRADMFAGNSGTTMRFLTAVAALDAGQYRLDGNARMRMRPIQDLLDALNSLGSKAYSEFENGCPPVLIQSYDELEGGELSLKSNISSQYASALLMIAPLTKHGITITIEGEIASKPFIDMTLGMLDQWHYESVRQGNVIHVAARECWNASIDYEIEPDATAASYYFSAAAIVGGHITIPGMHYSMIQGDVKYVRILEQLGCHIESESNQIRVSSEPSGQKLSGISVDMNAIPDTVMTLAAVACFADSPTTIRNVAHIRHKESDRIAALTAELRKLGVEVEEYPDGLMITPRPMKGCMLETYNDHRLAMSFALIGLKVPGVVICNPGCVAKTYPDFWRDFEKLYINAS